MPPTNELRFSPQPKQREFLATSADLAVYGGGAGSGKSWSLCYCPLRHIHKPGFYGVVFRGTSPEITNSGGLWDEASGMFPAAGGRGVRGDLEFRWRNNVKISFRHLEHEQDKYSYQGSQFAYIGFDELTHFNESMFWYLLSRNRSRCGVRPYVRCTTNPDPGWVKTRLLAPWVDEDYRGEPAKSGEIRWIKRVKGEIQWSKTRTEHAKSLTFIRASVYDNRILLEADAGYIGNLMALPEIEKQRLLHGNWRVRHEGLVYPHFQNCIVDAPRRLQVPPTHGGGDWGWRNPTAFVWGHVHDDVIWVTGCRYESGVPLQIHSQHIPRGVVWWVDPADPESAHELRLADHDVRACRHMSTRGASGEKRSPKMSGIAAVSARMASGRLKIVVCEETKPLLYELGMYAYDPTKTLEEPIDKYNHACDALRYWITSYDRGRLVTDREPEEAL